MVLSYWLTGNRQICEKITSTVSWYHKQS